MKYIESILPENVADSLARLLSDDVTISSVLKDLLHRDTGCDVPSLDDVPTSDIEEMIPLCLSILRRFWNTPLTALGDGINKKSFADTFKRLINNRVQGNEVLGIPPANENIATAVSALRQRDMSSGLTFTWSNGTTTSLLDGLSLAQLLCGTSPDGTDLASQVTEIVDSNRDWTMTKGWNNTLFPSLKDLTINCDTLAFKSGRPFANTTIERLSFPSCKTIDGKYDITYNGLIEATKVPIQLEFPVLEVIDQTNGGVERSFFKGVVQFKDDTLRFPKLNRIIGAQYFFYNQLNFPRYLYLDELQSFNGDWGIGAGQSIMELFYAPNMTSSTNNNPLNSHKYSSDFNHYVNLIDLWIGEWNTDLNLSQWSPINVVSDSDKVAILNHNIREHIAARIADRTDKTALTITFRSTIFSVLENETKAAFTNKNWTIANTQNMV